MHKMSSPNLDNLVEIGKLRREPPAQIFRQTAAECGTQFTIPAGLSQYLSGDFSVPSYDRPERLSYKPFRCRYRYQSIDGRGRSCGGAC